jgi:hypothetical protein
MAMKWFVYIFSFYILVLSDIPCSAGDDCCNDEQANHSDDKPTSPCAPFFACGTYHGVTIPDIFTELPKEVPPTITLQYFYKEQALPHFSTSIWQPPKTA